MINAFKTPILQGPGSQTKIVTLWDFLSEVPRKVVHPDVMHAYAMTYKRRIEYWSSTYADIDDSVYARTELILRQNPTKILSDIKKSLTKFSTKKHVVIEELMYDLNYRMAQDCSLLTHAFSVGSNQFALVNINDFTLYVKRDYKQSLLCQFPERNYIVRAPNINFSW